MNSHDWCSLPAAKGFPVMRIWMWSMAVEHQAIQRDGSHGVCRLRSHLQDTYHDGLSSTTYEASFFIHLHTKHTKHPEHPTTGSNSRLDGSWWCKKNNSYFHMLLLFSDSIHMLIPHFSRHAPGGPRMACGPVMAGWSTPGSWRVDCSPPEAARDWRHHTWTSDVADKDGGFMCFTINHVPPRKKQ